MSLVLIDDLRCDGLDAILANLSGGELELRSGPAPANVTDPPSGTLLVSYSLGSPAFPACSGGSASANGLPMSENALATNSIGHYRVQDGSNNTLLHSNSVGLNSSGAELEMNTLETSTGVAVSITAWSFTFPDTSPC